MDFNIAKFQITFHKTHLANNCKLFLYLLTLKTYFVIIGLRGDVHGNEII